MMNIYNLYMLSWLIYYFGSVHEILQIYVKLLSNVRWFLIMFWSGKCLLSLVRSSCRPGWPPMVPLHVTKQSWDPNAGLSSFITIISIDEGMNKGTTLSQCFFLVKAWPVICKAQYVYSSLTQSHLVIDLHAITIIDVNMMSLTHERSLKHWDWDKMAAILQKTFWNYFSCMKIAGVL